MRILSGIQPTGAKHVGNYVGAIRHYVEQQEQGTALYFIADMHALTVTPDPEVIRRDTLSTAAMLLAAGVDVDPAGHGATLFVQSHAGAEHAELAWVLQCVASMGELRRMTQFKDKAGDRGDQVSVGLFTYPVLQAADILAHDIDVVPVGADQKQHLELVRDIAQRFNSRYGGGRDMLVVPEPRIAEVGARVMDLQDPTRKMSTTGGTEKGTLFVLDEPARIMKKVKSAMTDSDPDVRFDREAKPGIANLLELMHVATGRPIGDLVGEFGRAGYGTFKVAVAEALVEYLAPIRERYHELMDDRAELERVLAAGAEVAREQAARRVAEVKDAVGLLPPVAAATRA